VNRIAEASARLDARIDALGGSPAGIEVDRRIVSMLYVGLPVSSTEGEHYVSHVLRELYEKVEHGVDPHEVLSGALTMVLHTGLLSGAAGE
jgi:hypothetical protein